MLNDYYDFNISGHFLPAIINGDYSGLNDFEVNLLDDFLNKYSKLDNATWDVDSIESQDSRFIDCDITELFSDCYNVKLHFTNESIKG